MGKYRTCRYKASKSSGRSELNRVNNSKDPNVSVIAHRIHDKNGTNFRGKFKGNPKQGISRLPSLPICTLLLIAVFLLVLETCPRVSGQLIVSGNKTGNKGNKSSSQSNSPNSGGHTNLPVTSNLSLEEIQAVGPDEGLINCSHPSSDDFPPDLFSLEAKRHGAIILHFGVSIYLFYALLLVCDEYFVPAVECICRELGIRTDVAGASIMAMSTSCPELFTNVIGTFLTDGDIGVGTIVGSAVFNILAVGACCGIGAGYKLAKSGDKVGVRLEWWPLTRDSLFYVVSVGALIGILANRKVYWGEALLMILLYLLYILVLCFNTQAKCLVERALVCLSFKSESKEPHRISIIVGKIFQANENTPLLLSVGEKDKDQGMKNGKKELLSKTDSTMDLLISKEYDIPEDQMDQVLIHNALSRSGSFSQSSHFHSSSKQDAWSSESSDSDGDSSKGIGGRVRCIVSIPIHVLLYLTIPDCKIYDKRKWSGLTLAMCVAWIGALTYVISWMVSIIGNTLAIPDSVTGLTFLAAGTSIPEVISSLIVARQGLGSMGFSNTIGSNTFDILICLGLPWFIKCLLLVGSDVDYIQIHSGGLEYSAVILISALLLLYFFIAFNGFVLDRKIGIASIVMYVIFITFACMLEMNVFFPVNLPPC